MKAGGPRGINLGARLLLGTRLLRPQSLGDLYQLDQSAFARIPQEDPLSQLASIRRRYD